MTASVAAATMALAGTATQAHASTSSAYDVSAGNPGFVQGNLIWYNRSVQVGGTLISYQACDAVVYTGYDGGGNQVARQQRGYICGGQLGHGFTLDASTVVGGIQTVLVDIYVANDSAGDGAYLAGRETCDRDYNNTGYPFCH